MRRRRRRRICCRICYENRLSLTLFGLFVLCVVGQSVAAVITAIRNAKPITSPWSAIEPIWAQAIVSKRWARIGRANSCRIRGAYMLLTVFLRQKGSPESKPVHHPHSETGRQ